MACLCYIDCHYSRNTFENIVEKQWTENNCMKNKTIAWSELCSHPLVYVATYERHVSYVSWLEWSPHNNKKSLFNILVFFKICNEMEMTVEFLFIGGICTICTLLASNFFYHIMCSASKILNKTVLELKKLSFHKWNGF